MELADKRPARWSIEAAKLKKILTPNQKTTNLNLENKYYEI